MAQSDSRYSVEGKSRPERTFNQIAAKGSFDVGFSDALRERLGDADRCLASEKRSSGKLRGWAWWVVCCYGDLVGGFASDMT